MAAQHWSARATLAEDAFPPQVLDWCAAHGLHDRWGARPARWPSEQEWRADVGKRRAALHPLPTFLHALLQRLGQARAAAPCNETMATPCLGAAPDRHGEGGGTDTPAGLAGMQVAVAVRAVRVRGSQCDRSTAEAGGGRCSGEVMRRSEAVAPLLTCLQACVPSLAGPRRRAARRSRTRRPAWSAAWRAPAWPAARARPHGTTSWRCCCTC